MEEWDDGHLVTFSKGKHEVPKAVTDTSGHLFLKTGFGDVSKS